MRIFHSCWLLAGRIVNRKYFSTLVHEASSSSSSLRFSKTVNLRSDEDLTNIGFNFGNLLVPGDVLLLSGDLGAGKTCFSRGIVWAKFNDKEMHVTSPSYLLDNWYRYDEDKYIHHIDLFRLPKGADLSILNIPNIYNNSICMLEWPQRIREDQYPPSYIDVRMTVKTDDSRDVQVTAVGERWTEVEHKQRIAEAFDQLSSSQ